MLEADFSNGASLMPAAAMVSSSAVVKVALPDASLHVSAVGKAVKVVALIAEVAERKTRRMRLFIV